MHERRAAGRVESSWEVGRGGSFVLVARAGGMFGNYCIWMVIIN